MKVLALLLCLAVTASARMAYIFSNSYLDILGAEPVHSFDCTGRPYGYYADVAANCQVFHVCVPIPDQTGQLLETHHFSFFCNNKTIFNQESLTCDHEEYAFPCSEAETLFELSNADFGIIPEGGFEGTPIVFPDVEARTNIVDIPAEPAAPAEPAESVEPTAPVESEEAPSSGSGRSIQDVTSTKDVDVAAEEKPETNPEERSEGEGVDVEAEETTETKPERSEGEVNVESEVNVDVAAEETTETKPERSEGEVIDEAKPEETPEAEVTVDTVDTALETQPEGEVHLAIPGSVPSATSSNDEDETTISIVEEIPEVTSTSEVGEDTENSLA